jgi:hypothetical protein
MSGLTDNLPFKLSLTDSQKMARSNVMLPYMKAQDAQGGCIGFRDFVWLGLNSAGLA